MIYTTLARIRAHRPCQTGWRTLLAHLGKTRADNAPLPMTAILDSNGLEDALWCLRAEPQHAAIWRLYAVRTARRVQHLMTDQRSLHALDVAEAHAWGRATDTELADAYVAASAAAAAAYAAYAATRAASASAASAAAAAAYAASASAASASYASYVAERKWQASDLRAALTAYEAPPGCVGVPTP
jgi:hypothetical protein